MTLFKGVKQKGGAGSLGSGRTWSYHTAGPPLTPTPSCTPVLSVWSHPLHLSSTPCLCDQTLFLSRKALEERRKAEEEEERWRETQRQREKRLQRLVSQRAQANDPHLALAQSHQDKLKEFRSERRCSGAACSRRRD